jgi:hypothetical protein
MSAMKQPHDDIVAFRGRVAAIIAEFDVPLPEGDAALDEAVRRLDEMGARFSALHREFEITVEIEEEEINGYREPLDSRFHDLLIETEPRTLAGAVTLLHYLADDKNALLVTPSDELVANALVPIERAAEMGSETSASDPDTAILTLFRQWVAGQRAAQLIDDQSPDGDLLTAANERLDELLDRISATPSQGITGFAVKAYLAVHAEHYPFVIGFDSAGLAPFTDPPEEWHADTHSIIGAMRDAARFVPELAPLVAQMIGEPASDESQIGFGPIDAGGAA